jgi:hypothetical protein
LSTVSLAELNTRYSNKPNSPWRQSIGNKLTRPTTYFVDASEIFDSLEDFNEEI